MDLEDANRDSDRERSLTAGHGEGARLSIQREELEVHRTRERQRESVRIARNPLTRGPFGPTEATHEREREWGRGNNVDNSRNLAQHHAPSWTVRWCIQFIFLLLYPTFPPKKNPRARSHRTLRKCRQNRRWWRNARFTAHPYRFFSLPLPFKLLRSEYCRPIATYFQKARTSSSENLSNLRQLSQISLKDVKSFCHNFLFLKEILHERAKWSWRQEFGAGII